MDDVLPKLLSFPPHPPPPTPISDQQYDEGIRDQIDIAKTIPAAKLLQQTSGGENALDVINPALNTVAYTFIIIANIETFSKGQKDVNMDTVWSKMLGYLKSYDTRQIRYLGAEFLRIIDAVLDTARSSNKLSLAIAPVRDALLRLDPSVSVLTRAHVSVIKLALHTRTYGDILPILNNIILYMPGASNLPKPKYLCDLSLRPASYVTVASGFTGKMKYIDLLEYFLCCGLACLGSRQWAKALLHFECAITYPAKEVTSKVMVEAYKKWVLTGLLLEGKLLSLPNSTGSNASKTFHILGKPYEILAQIFENGSASRLKSEVEAGKFIWQKDCNTGLVLHVLAAFQKFQIRNLADIYSKISIPEIHHHTTSAESGAKLPTVNAVESLVQEMINQGELHATLNVNPNGTSVLTFSPTGPTLTEAQIQRELAASTKRIHSLAREIKLTGRILTYDKEYIKHLQKLRKSAKSGTSPESGVTGQDTTMDWNDIVEDEDIMGGSMY